MIDDESHLINYCVKYKKINLYEEDEWIDLEQIHSVNMDEVLLKIWNLEYKKN